MRGWSWPILVAVAVDGLVGVAGLVFGLNLALARVGDPGDWTGGLRLFFGLLMAVPAGLLLVFTACLAGRQRWARIGLIASWFLGLGVISVMTKGLGWIGAVILAAALIAVIASHAGLFMFAAQAFFRRPPAAGAVARPPRPTRR